MNHFMFLLVVASIDMITAINIDRIVSKRQHEELESEHRKAICCEKKMRCCNKRSPPPIEIRAILARCPNLGSERSNAHLTRDLRQPVIKINEPSLRSFQGFDEDEPLLQSRVVNCKRKVLMTLKMHHKGELGCKNQYIVVDHVFDPVSEKSVRLLNPYVIRLRQQPVSLTHFLKFMDYVNSEAYEQIYNKHDSNYKGCYATKYKSTCGIVKYEGTVIPYSEGFCCSCDAKKNLERQPESINGKNEAIISYSDPAYLLDHVECPRNFYKDRDEAEHSEEPPPQSQEVTNNEQISTSTECANVTKSCATTGATIQNSSEIVSPPNGPHKLFDVETSVGPVANSEVYDGLPKDESKAGLRRSDDCNLLKSTTQSSGHKRWKYTTYSQRCGKKDDLHKYLTAPAGSIKTKRRSPGKELNKYLKNLQLSGRNNRALEGAVKPEYPDHIQLYVDHLIDQLGDNVFTQRLIRKMRQTYPSGGQVRGNQNCANRYTPPGMDPETYHESTHCLRFSDVWYGIYKFGDPFIEQTISINIYERFESETSSDKWREITNGTIKMGSRSPFYEDELPTISMQFTSKATSDPDSMKTSKLHHQRILIPEGVRKCDMHNYPEMKNGAEEYLVVKPTQIAIEGDQCDKIGVGFEAFSKQPMRCNVPKSTCLHNQPKHLWMRDKKKENKGLKGCYFLKYHANITKEPILVNETTGDKYLSLEYNGSQLSNLDIEIKADFNAVIRLQTTAVITEVYVDSTCDKITILTVKVINSGLISSKYMVQLGDFPLDVSYAMGKIKSKLTLIPPQNQHIFSLEIRTPLPADLMYCSLEVLNYNKELVALRRVRLQKYDRCICTWHCLCACVASSTGLKCIPMSLEQYHAAGFQGALPLVTYMVHFTLLDDLLSLVFYFAVFLLAVLLLLGLCKACLGLCWYGAGVWGLSIIMELPRKISRYYEPSLRRYNVIYDKEGYPIHPKSKNRVRDMSHATLFCINLVFFLTYPLSSCVLIFRRLCCSYYMQVPGKEAHAKRKHGHGTSTDSCDRAAPKKRSRTPTDTKALSPKSSRSGDCSSAHSLAPEQRSEKSKYLCGILDKFAPKKRTASSRGATKRRAKSKCMDAGTKKSSVLFAQKKNPIVGYMAQVDEETPTTSEESVVTSNGSSVTLMIRTKPGEKYQKVRIDKKMLSRIDRSEEELSSPSNSTTVDEESVVSDEFKISLLPRASASVLETGTLITEDEEKHSKENITTSRPKSL